MQRLFGAGLRPGFKGSKGGDIALSGDAFASQKPILTAPRISFQRKEAALRAYLPSVTVILSVSEDSLYMPIVSHLPINTSRRELAAYHGHPYSGGRIGLSALSCGEQPTADSQ